MISTKLSLTREQGSAGCPQESGGHPQDNSPIREKHDLDARLSKQGWPPVGAQPPKIVRKALTLTPISCEEWDAAVAQSRASAAKPGLAYALAVIEGLRKEPDRSHMQLTQEDEDFIKAFRGMK